jgi:Copper amine oxidase N-terminal domain
MKKIAFGLCLCFLIFTAYGSQISSVYADDDEKYEHKLEYEDEDRHEDDYDHEDEEEHEDGYGSKEYYREERTIVKREYWYKWSRSADLPDEYVVTPVSSKQTVPICLESKPPLYTTVIPMQGQIFVPLEDTAKYLGASVIIYPNSQIGEIQLGDHHLIVKNGTRVVYENMRKTPMPLPIFAEKEKLYIPISVLANGLGFQVTWTKQQQIRIY